MSYRNDLFAMPGQNRLVGGDDWLPDSQCRKNVLFCRLYTTHDFHDDIDVRRTNNGFCALSQFNLVASPMAFAARVAYQGALDDHRRTTAGGQQRPMFM
ncbi:MAG: hypothetical protein R3C68_17100 [Myxococcota bacterium]